MRALSLPAGFAVVNIRLSPSPACKQARICRDNDKWQVNKQEIDDERREDAKTQGHTNNRPGIQNL